MNEVGIKTCRGFMLMHVPEVSKQLLPATWKKTLNQGLHMGMFGAELLIKLQKLGIVPDVHSFNGLNQCGILSNEIYHSTIKIKKAHL